MKILKLLLKIFEKKPKLKRVIDYGQDPVIGDFIISISSDRGLIYGKKYEVTRLYYNNGAIDTVDFDSFSYRLVHGIVSKPNNSVSYSSPFTPRYFITPYCVPPTTITCVPNPKTNPPRGLFFDTTNGDIIVTPTKCDEVGVGVIEMVEWRKDSATGKYIVIGRTRRDMQVWVRDDCGYNKAPTLGPKFTYKVCEGETLKFKVESDDETFTPYQTTPDTTTMKWNNGIPGAKFTLNVPTRSEFARRKEALRSGFTLVEKMENLEKE